METGLRSVRKEELVSEQEEEEAPIWWIPEELHVYLLGFLEFRDLGRVARVNHYLNRLSTDEQIWERVQTLSLPSWLSRTHILDFIHKCPDLRKLYCGNCAEQLDSATASHVIESCSRLVELDISRCPSIDEACFEMLSDTCGGLEVLKAGDNSHFNVDCFLKLVDKCSELRVLDVSGCRAAPYSTRVPDEISNQSLEVLSLGNSDVYDEFASSLGTAFPNLRDLDLSHTQVTVGSISDILGLSQLSNLDLSECDGIFQLNNFSHEELETLKLNECKHLASFSISCKKLRSFEFFGCTALTGFDVRSPCLESVALEGLPLLSSFRLFARNLKRLEFHQISATIELASIQRVASDCRNIEELVIRDSPLPFDTISTLVTQLPKLRHLAIAKVAVSQLVISSESLSSLRLEDIPNNLEGSHFDCPKLSQLEILRCPEFNDACTALLLSKNSLVETVLFAALARVSSESLRLIARSCNSIRSLTCTESPWVDSFSSSSTTLQSISFESCKALEWIELQCPLLERLNLNWCAKLKKARIECPNLSELVAHGFEGCQVLQDLRLSSDRLRALELKNMIRLNALDVQCKALESISLTKCTSVSQEAFETILSKCGNVRDISLAGCKDIRQLRLKGYSSLRSLMLGELRSLSTVDLEDCKSLQSLQIAWCGKIQDKVIRDAIRIAESLRTLKLRGIPHLAVLDISSSSLETFTLEKCLQLTTLKIEAESLFRLEIRGCNALKEASLKCRQVKVLDMDTNHKLASLCFDSFSNFSLPMAKRIKTVVPNLQYLNLKGCMKVDEKAVIFALENLEKLDRAILASCDLSPELRQLKRSKLDIN